MEGVVAIHGANFVVHIVSGILDKLTGEARNVSSKRHHSIANKSLHLLVGAAESKLVKRIDQEA